MTEKLTITTPDGPIDLPVIQYTSDEVDYFTERYGGKVPLAF